MAPNRPSRIPAHSPPCRHQRSVWGAPWRCGTHRCRSVHRPVGLHRERDRASCAVRTPLPDAGCNPLSSNSHSNDVRFVPDVGAGRVARSARCTTAYCVCGFRACAGADPSPSGGAWRASDVRKDAGRDGWQCIHTYLTQYLMGYRAPHGAVYPALCLSHDAPDHIKHLLIHDSAADGDVSLGRCTETGPPGCMHPAACSHSHRYRRLAGIRHPGQGARDHTDRGCDGGIGVDTDRHRCRRCMEDRGPHSDEKGDRNAALDKASYAPAYGRRGLAIGMATAMPPCTLDKKDNDGEACTSVCIAHSRHLGPAPRTRADVDQGMAASIWSILQSRG